MADINLDDSNIVTLITKAISDSLYDTFPTGSVDILLLGCEAAGYPDPDSARAALVDNATKTVIRSLKGIES